MKMKSKMIQVLGVEKAGCGNLKINKFRNAHFKKLILNYNPTYNEGKHVSREIMLQRTKFELEYFYRVFGNEHKR